MLFGTSTLYRLVDGLLIDFYMNFDVFFPILFAFSKNGESVKQVARAHGLSQTSFRFSICRHSELYHTIGGLVTSLPLSK